MPEKPKKLTTLAVSSVLALSSCALRGAQPPSDCEIFLDQYERVLRTGLAQKDENHYLEAAVTVAERELTRLECTPAEWARLDKFRQHIEAE